MIEVDSVASPNRTLSVISEQLMHKAAFEIRRIGKGKSWGKILVIPVPVRLTTVRLPREVECDFRLGRGGLAHQHALGTRVKPIVQTESGRSLFTVSLVRRLQ